MVTSDFDGFRKVRHLSIQLSLYHFEFHTKTLPFSAFNMSSCVLTKQHVWCNLVFGFIREKLELVQTFVEVCGAPSDKSDMEWFGPFKNEPSFGQTKKFEAITRLRSESNARGALQN